MLPFTPLEWVLFGFVGVVACLMIYYAVNSAKAMNKKKLDHSKKEGVK